ncbi:MAG: anaerobic glycerol-3-phosphate dehydrogenase subunit A [Chloroflexi bacterium]|nr:anaerobic glycerol-3-phosphate dehydrogenase subunit A [Chloroflexota bacterium]
MRTLQTEILVIGGGATGTGVLRDLAMRGFRALLVEKADLAYGTTGRFHGLLHSGARYAVKDSQAAHECILENHILRRIMPHCIEDTGGFFVLTPQDDPAYADRFLQGCQAAGIPFEEISIAQMLRAEPRLNPQITRCFRVPDGSADSFLAAELNAESARQHGAQALTYHLVQRLLLSEGGPPRVIGAVCLDRASSEEVAVHADLVVNAAGAWAGKLAAAAGAPVHIVGGKGVMIAASHRLVNTVINRCRMPTDGDILVPAHTVAVMGTTDVRVADPDHITIEDWEVRLNLEQGELLVPGFKEQRILRAWAGVRPLYQESDVSATRNITRAFVLLDHAARDGVEGLVTITSGKWTTYRKMAEATVDLCCQKLGVQRACSTHEQILPSREGAHYHALGARLARVEEQKSYGSLLCECELATYDDVAEAITVRGARSLDDIRRDVRLGMGPCQGGFCALRAAGLLQHLAPAPLGGDSPALAANAALRDFLQERWKGLLPILWSQQLRQERLDELIYLDVLNVAALPLAESNPFAAEMYAQPDPAALPAAPPAPLAPRPSPASPASPSLDLLIIGGGLAGLAAAWTAARRGRRVRLVARGWGATHWASGCIDVLGYPVQDGVQAARSPRQALEALIRRSPSHPYALAGLDSVEFALREFQALCEQAGYPMLGSLEHNWLLPSALGAPRPTCLAPRTMLSGDLTRKDPMLIVGFKQYLDFYPEWIAANLQKLGIAARALLLDLPELQKPRFITTRVLASLFENAAFRQAAARAVKISLHAGERVGFPAVLGLRHVLTIQQDLEYRLGAPVFEIPGLPPSIPGIRLHQILLQALEDLGAQVYDGMPVVAAEADGPRLTAAWSEAAARRKAHRARYYLLATGGILGGGVQVHPDGYTQETALGLPLAQLSFEGRGLMPEFLAPQGHPLFSSGLAVDASFTPLDPQGEPVYNNLFAAGGALAGFDPLRERSLEGVALATAWRVGKNLPL